jgi:hypothetical protein
MMVDLIVENGRIHTGDPEAPVVDAVAVLNGSSPPGTMSRACGRASASARTTVSCCPGSMTPRRTAFGSA